MVNFNGTLVEPSLNLFNSNNRAFKYGDALFETLKIKNSKILFLEDHYFRLMASMRMLRMEIPMMFTLEFFEAEIRKTFETLETWDARIRITVFRMDGGLYSPENHAVNYLIEAKVHKNNQLEGYNVDIFKEYYIHSGLLSSLKTTNKITHVLASIYASENQLDNCILINERKEVVEFTNGNIFIVKDSAIKTPPITSGCIKGVLRKNLLKIASKLNGYSIEETNISPFELQKADEIFMTNVMVGIQAISKFRNIEFKSAVTSRLKLELDNLV
jgi:branched-chain amino acid aminotransferase